ncbi:hypothetical protein AYL99_07044 [Fonsecaea erecta]|uniref:Uncharacterized protein n=1 Tax=Fonsecaea erecta TaxID=1367422 RepID=A0A178ZDS1_9EURO|nr:hypothetical protein AYL99_07044 [Fonsecaea erecta]OAP57954.1 hypothetical protein AYL99_07044 [Fonsecaea erecta]
MGRERALSRRTEDEKLAIRREKVRLNVQAHRERQRLKKRLEVLNEPCQPKLRWIQETKWQLQRKADTHDQDQVAKSAGPRREGSPKLDCCIAIHPSPGKQYTLALLAMLRTRLLPDRVILRSPGIPEQRLTTPCAPWVVRGYELAADKEDPLLMGMLRSLGLALLGADHQRKDIQTFAQRTYQTALRAVSRQLGLLMSGHKHSSNDHPTLILSCHAAAMFELNVGGSLSDMSRLVRGLGSLLVHHFLESNSMQEDIFDLMEEYRLFEMVFCLVNRQKSVLSGTILGREEKCLDNPDPDLGNCRMSLLTKLVHIGACIPPIMVYADRLKSTTVTSDKEHGPMGKFLKTLSSAATELQLWRQDFLANETPPVMGSLTYTSEYNNPEFQNLEIVTAWTYYLSIKIHTLETYAFMLEHATLIQPSSTNIEAAEEGYGMIDVQLSSPDEKIILLRSELLDTTRLLLRSMPYFSDASLGHIGRSLIAFPLETVKRALLGELERRSSLACVESEIASLKFSGHQAQDIIQDLVVWREIATNAKASGCALFSH